jgi:hypothetical protein
LIVSDDERDEHDYEMREPDFGRVLNVHSRADQRDGSTFTEHGDPVRWGSTAEVSLTLADENRPVYSEQIVRVDRKNAYPCNWQMVGELVVPAAWADSPTTSLQWFALLEIIMGTGQTVVTQNVNLRALIDLAVPPALLATGQSWYTPRGVGGSVGFPWVMPGGLVGKSIQVRAIFLVAPEFGLAPANVRISAEVSPFNAGDKA